MKVSYVVLQYNLYEKTFECINQIFLNTQVEFEVVIVDNYSTNSAYDIVKNKYKNVGNITVIQTPRNLGFANGNNYGVQYVTT
ncbi:MAG: glycosyltransferase, partial [Turicibacter sp.]|nr:glycosyltransferase [Turicibacter sp.]